MLLVAGGTGVAPFAQLLTVALDPEKQSAVFGKSARVTRFSIILSNHTVRDMLWREHLDDIAAGHPSRVRVLYTLTSHADGAVPDGWRGGTSRVNAGMVTWLLDWSRGWSDDLNAISVPTAPAGASAVSYRRSAVLCGPQGMMDSVQALLLAAGVPDDDIVALDA